MNILSSHTREELLEKIGTLEEQLLTELDSIDSSEQMLEAVMFQSKFFNYSSRNTMLIRAQSPTIAVNSYNRWKEQGYYVKRGSKAIHILAPSKVKYVRYRNGLKKYSKLSKDEKKEVRQKGLEIIDFTGYKPVPVFAIEDTTYPKEEYPELFKGVDSAKYPELLEDLKEFVSSKYKLPIWELKMEGQVKGALQKDISKNENRIVLNKENSVDENLTTLIHELMHFKNEHLENNNKSSAQMELEAEMSTFVLSQLLGIDDKNIKEKSLTYCDNWLSVISGDENKNNMKLNVLDNIRKNTADIYHEIQDFIQIENTQQVQVQR